MKILACFKAAPNWDRVLDEDWAAFSPHMDLAYAGRVPGCFDESALALAPELGGECHALTAGAVPPAPLTTLLYASGYSQVQVAPGPPAEFCPEYTARRLALAAQAENYDVIFTGMAAGMADTGAVPPLLAQHLGLPWLAGVEAVRLEEGSLWVAHRTGEGLRQSQVEGPLVLAVGNSPALLKVVPLRRQLAARAKQVIVLDLPTEAPPKTDPLLRAPGQGRRCRMLDSADLPAAARLLRASVQGPKGGGTP